MDTDSILATSVATIVLGSSFLLLITNVFYYEDCKCKRGKCERDCITCRRKCKRDCDCGRGRAETDEELIGV